MTYNEAMEEYRKECEEIEEQCKEEGYPSNGSNSELRKYEAYKYYMSLVEED